MDRLCKTGGSDIPMKPIRFSAGLLAALILGFNSPTQAEVPLTVTLGAALHTFDDGHNLDSEVLPVAAIEYRFDSNWAGQLAWSWGEAEADDSGEDVDIENWQLGITYYFTPGESLHPYLGFGGGELSKEFGDSDKAQTQANVGAGFRYYLGDHWNWQADARLLHSFSDSDNDLALTVGIAYDFADPPRRWSLRQCRRPTVMAMAWSTASTNVPIPPPASRWMSGAARCRSSASPRSR